MYEYLATVRLNDGKTDELLYMQRIIFTNDNPLTEHDYDEIFEYLQNNIEYDFDDVGVFRVDMVRLDEDDDGDDGDDDDPPPPDDEPITFNVIKGVNV